MKPLVLVTGANGNIGSSVMEALAKNYRVVGLDNESRGGDGDFVEVDITERSSVRRAFAQIGERHGHEIAAVVHLIAYFDFTGEESPLYNEVNVEGTKLLLEALKDFAVERFIYASTMLVHEPVEPGQLVSEETPFGPRWAYPESKLAVEEVIRRGAAMPYAILRLAGVYDEETAVPTLSHQIARIYERDFKSHLYSGALEAGQSMLHRQDMLDAFCRAVDRRSDLPSRAEILIGEPLAVGYGDLQDKIGCLVHGAEEWETIRIPKALAKAGAFAQEAAEPIIPDAIDKGEKPFIRPFMIEMADDHYALDIGRAQDWLGWRPKHRLEDELPAMIRNLKDDPAGWYERNKLPAPRGLAEVGDEDED